jgi:hypothetical protein
MDVQEKKKTKMLRYFDNTSISLSATAQYAAGSESEAQ